MTTGGFLTFHSGSKETHRTDLSGPYLLSSRHVCFGRPVQIVKISKVVICSSETEGSCPFAGDPFYPQSPGSVVRSDNMPITVVPAGGCVYQVPFPIVEGIAVNMIDEFIMPRLHDETLQAN
jgi:hypothetical protein